MKFAIALTAPVVLIASAAVAQQAPLSAHGERPDWQLTIGGGTIRYADHRGRVVLRAPAPRIGFAGELYVARGMRINVVHGRCTINGAGLAYPMKVGVSWRGRTLWGCGGSPVDRPPLGHGPGVAALDGSAWTIASVDGAPAATARPTTIRFANGRVEGNAGCNSFGGTYEQRGAVLDAGQIISTKMACPGPGMEIERKVFGILEGPSQLSYRGSDTLEVSTAGSSMTLSRTH
ncbi:MAG: META domain-containing protein [Sphingomonas sp.]